MARKDARYRFYSMFFQRIFQMTLPGELGTELLRAAGHMASADA
ncbi:MAG: hypothetical protein OJF51_003910 [Nitrospira sp.]|nr:MAG: hypothetical protein OJF51_003910 [Nitrospira sp.]